MPSQNEPSPPRNGVVPMKQRRNLVLPILLLLGGILIGTFIAEPLALAAGVGVLLSWLVGIFIVAPRAGAIAKYSFFNTLADPTEEDMVMIEAAATHIIGNAAKIAQDPERRALFATIFQAFMEEVNRRWEMTLNNIRSQRAKGIGPYNPGNHLQEQEMLNDIVGGIIGSVAEPFINAVGLEGQRKENALNYITLRMMGAFGSNGGSGQLPPGSPHHYGSNVIDYRGQ